MENKDSIKKNTNKGKFVLIIGIIVLVITFATVGIVYWLFTEQYNSNGVSHFLVITIDKNKEREHIGRLDGYVEEWKKYAFSTRKSNASLILVFENYEIVLTGDECLIRPRL